MPDILIESAVNHMVTVVGARTLFELKQINFLVQYTQQYTTRRARSAAAREADHDEMRRDIRGA